jgi:MFS transporter, FSR family, fosmidomycin resistance protein
MFSRHVMSDSLHRNRTLWLATVLHAFTHMYQIALIPLYLLIQKDFQLQSEGEATFLVTALSIAYFLPSYPMGILADRLSRKKLLGWGLFVNALAFVALSFAPSYGWAVACVILAGLGGSFYHPAATALVARLYPGQTGKALGKVGIGAGVGFLLGPLYSGWRSAGVNWRQPILEMGILGLIGAALFMWLAKEQPAGKPAARDDQHGAARKLFPTSGLRLLFFAASVAFCFRDFAGAGMATLSSLFLQHARGFDVAKTGLTIGWLYLASIISNPIFGHLSDKRRTPLTALVLVCAAAAIFAFPLTPTGLIVPVLAVYGFFFMASYPMVEAALMESVHDSVRGRVFGFFITVGGLVGNLSHWLIGEAVRRLGPEAHNPASYFGIYATLGVFVLISLAGLAALHRLHHAHQQKIAPIAVETV